MVTTKLFFTPQIIQLTRLFDCIDIIQWLMSGCAWHGIHYSFNNYWDVVPFKGASTSPSEEPSTFRFLELEVQVELTLCIVFPEELGVDFPLPRLLLDQLLDLDFPLDVCLV